MVEPGERLCVIVGTPDLCSEFIVVVSLGVRDNRSWCFKRQQPHSVSFTNSRSLVILPLVLYGICSRQSIIKLSKSESYFKMTSWTVFYINDEHQ
jgi:hypothetical protein